MNDDAIEYIQKEIFRLFEIAKKYCNDSRKGKRDIENAINSGLRELEMIPENVSK